jgi:hypothetical protein
MRCEAIFLGAKVDKWAFQREPRSLSYAIQGTALDWYLTAFQAQDKGCAVA